MQNVDGTAVSLADLKGKTSLLYFFLGELSRRLFSYNLSNLPNPGEAEREGSFFPGNTALVSITIDPQRDTASSLKEFGGRFQAEWKGWYFLRGDEEKTKALAKDYGVFVNKEKDGSFTHSNVLLLVDGKGDFRTYYTADEDTINIDRIVSDMVQVSKETKKIKGDGSSFCLRIFSCRHRHHRPDGYRRLSFPARC